MNTKKINEERIRKLPKWMQQTYFWMKNSVVPSKLIFIVVSILATIWFFVRVIPKPSRATYPCMQLVAPVMSSFVVWMLSVSGSWLAFQKAKSRFKETRYLVGSVFILVAVGLGLFSTISSTRTARASGDAVRVWYQPNQPVGKAQGIFPGRVVWGFNPGTATWDGQTGFWWEDQYVDQSKVDQLLETSLFKLTNKNSEKEAWQALFVHFNKTKKKVNRGYETGEKIAIKINQNNTYSHDDCEEINTTPQLVLSMLKSLVDEGNVPQKNITVFDASRYITNHLFQKCHEVYPDVIFVDNAGGDGRVKSTYVANALVYSEDNGELAQGLASCAVDADYLINMAVLKGHVGQGVTLCAKNFYGVTSIHSDWRKNFHNNFDQDRAGKPHYMTFVDFMGHQDLGNKTMLFLVDGIYSNKFVNGKPEFKWKMKPFNNDWPSSLFVSQDLVAIDAVCTDFMLNEWPDAPDLEYCDAYLMEAATANHPASGTTYDPEGDGSTLNSLGVFEHWNNVADKQYSRNLGREEGIELILSKVGK